MPSFVEAAVEIALAAGSLLRYYGERRIGFELKGEFDLVTEADKASEKLVVERLRQYFPSHSIQAEEGGGGETGSEYRWYVDPLDGTTNFAHAYPVWSVTLALEKAGELIAGVVFDPNRDELFAAEKGAGAFLNGKRIQVSKTAKLGQSLSCTGFPNHARTGNPNIFFFYQLAMETHGVRRGGSAAIDLSYTACGRLDAFWEFGLKPWDLAAGKLMVVEAGGVCTDMRGGVHSMQSEEVMATNGLLHEELKARFGEVFRGELRHEMPRVG
ncbi:MAG TPA: inositol monophosphatase family protein [Bryobacteraceae bacterium]|nr:inositol monophosphatase family protein [Bryobacteraceae bacterium]